MTAAYPGPAYVIDTSVALKWFLEREEVDLLQARRLREAYLQGRCILRAPELLLFELANVLKHSGVSNCAKSIMRKFMTLCLATGHRLTLEIISEVLVSLQRVDLHLETFSGGTQRQGRSLHLTTLRFTIPISWPSRLNRVAF